MSAEHRQRYAAAIRQRRMPIEVGKHNEVVVHPKRYARRDYLRAMRLDVCAYCGENPQSSGLDHNLDHIEPKARGGTNEVTNLSGACQPCNTLKGDTDLLTFLLTTRVVVD